MKLRNLTYIIIALGAAVFSGCSKELDEKGGKEPGKGGNASLTINIETKRPTPFDGEAADGGAINDAYIFVVKDDDNVIDGIATLTANESTSESVTIENLDFGAHKVYVYANTEGFDNIYPAFKTTVKNLTKGDVFNYAEAQFENLASGALPQIANGEMPLTGLVKGIVLGAGSNSANIELVRPFAKLTIKVYNESKYRADVSGLSFNAFNPNTAYVFDHLPYASEYGGQYTPSLTYSVPTVSSAYATGQVDSGKESLIYEGLFYEGRLGADMHDTYRASLKLKFWDEAGLGRYMTFKEFSETQLTDARNIGGTRRTIKVGERYLICVNGNLMLSEKAPEKFSYPDSFLWDIEGGNYSQNGYSNCYIKSVASGKYLWMTGTKVGVYATTDPDYTTYSQRRVLRVAISGDGYYIKRQNEGDYLSIVTGSLGVTSTVTTTWTVSSVTTTIVDECNAADLIITNLDDEGATANMNKMLRNNHITIKLFVNYTDDPASDFIYYVNPWEYSTNEIVFN